MADTKKKTKTNPLVRDPLSLAVLKAVNNAAAKMIESDPTGELTEWAKSLGNLSDAEALERLKQTTWYQTNAKPARETILAEAINDADWKNASQTAQDIVASTAAQLGIQIPADKLYEAGREYLMKGWGTSASGLIQLKKYLTNTFMVAPSAAMTGTEGAAESPEQALGGVWTGQAGLTVDALRTAAAANGVQNLYDENFYLSAVKSVNSGLSTADDWKRMIREDAASMYPVIADKILAGTDAMVAATSAINTIANTYELDRNSIGFDNKYLKKYLTNVDETGKPKAMSLWEFERELRQGPEFTQTRQFRDEMGSVANTVLEKFGFVG